MLGAWSLCTVVCLAAVVSSVTGQQHVTVDTRHGALRGSRTVTGPGVYVDAFYNIPYAQPPTGNLRFHKPMSSQPWLGIRDATMHGPVCPQMSFGGNTTVVGEEDCLQLNVFTPKFSADNGPFPVMVWIHGGAYYFNSGNDFDGTELAGNGVVVVTINYRLGVFGFLSTADAASIGNYGLLDQIRALEWVRDTISSFNGDPNDVTIFGQSAGSASVSLLVLSREATGLFSKAIMESGVALCPWAVGFPRTDPQANYRQQAMQLAFRLGCPTSDTNHMLACLRTKNADDIVETTAKVELGQIGLALRPVPETTFGQYGMFSAVPDVILRNGWFNNVTVIRGFNKDENGFGLDKTDPDDDGITMEELTNMTRDFVTTYVTYDGTLPTDLVVKQVLGTYVDVPQVTDPKQLLAAFIQMTTDFSFVAPTFREQEMYYNAHGKTEYMYRFSHRSANRLNKPWQGVVHGDELAYVFGYPLSNDIEWREGVLSSWTDDDIRVSQHVMKLWTNFAKYGNPTPDSSSSGTRWLPWTQATPRLLDIGDQSTMVSAVNSLSMRLWNDVLPKMRRDAQTGLIG